MRDLTEANITEAVKSKIDSKDERFQFIMEKFVDHLHAFLREVEPNEDEWFNAVMFLTRTGQICTEERQEYMLFSDMVGVTSLLDMINHRSDTGATETTVTGPFHSPSVELENGAIIANGPEWAREEYALIKGHVYDTKGNIIAGAKVDVWQADDIGFYDSQDEAQPDINLRGIFTTNDKGEYWFRSIKPKSYPVPTDGPVGELLTAMGRHPMRPAHIHMMVSAPGFRKLITHVFVDGDEYLDSDAAFAVKESIIVDFVKNDDPEAAEKNGLPGPFYDVNFDIVLDYEL